MSTGSSDNHPFVIVVLKPKYCRVFDVSEEMKHSCLSGTFKNKPSIIHAQCHCDFHIEFLKLICLLFYDNWFTDEVFQLNPRCTTELLPIISKTDKNIDSS